MCECNRVELFFPASVNVLVLITGPDWVSGLYQVNFYVAVSTFLTRGGRFEHHFVGGDQVHVCGRWCRDLTRLQACRGS